jgi:hypothetical protein
VLEKGGRNGIRKLMAVANKANDESSYLPCPKDNSLHLGSHQHWKQTSILRTQELLMSSLVLTCVKPSQRDTNMTGLRVKYLRGCWIVGVRRRCVDVGSKALVGCMRYSLWPARW